MERTIHIHSIEETERLAKTLAENINAGDVITLEGDLGAGKTTFTQFFAKGIGITRTVNSPTFTIMKQYEGRLTFNHLDVYRLESADDDIGWDEIFYGDAVTIVEWASLIEDELPNERLSIHIQYLNETERIYKIAAIGVRYEQLLKELSI